MKLRFLNKVAIPGGPLYAAGAVADIDEMFVTVDRAVEYIRRGWAEEVREEPEMTEATTKAPVAPTVDKAILSRERAGTKQK